MFDIGGGSTEIIWLQRKGAAHGQRAFSASVPVGVVTLAETADAQSYEALRGEMRPLFASVRRRMARAGEFKPRGIICSAPRDGDDTGRIAKGLARYNRNKVDGSWHRTRDLHEIADEIAALDHAGRVARACIGEQRAELMVPGLAIFAAICAEWPCADLCIADRGLREGMLREMMAEMEN